MEELVLSCEALKMGLEEKLDPIIAEANSLDQAEGPVTAGAIRGRVCRMVVPNHPKPGIL